jgi:Ca2+-transporting ATPase
MWWGIVVTSIVMRTGMLLLLDAGLPGGPIDGGGDAAYARSLAFNTLVLYQLVAVPGVRSPIRAAPRERAVLRIGARGRVHIR